jgi:2'-5' RNA ligase
MRVFAALPLPDAVLHALGDAAAALKRQNPRLRTTGFSGMHVTLHFFGEIDEKSAEKLGAFWEGGDFARPRISASLGPLGRFPERGTPRVIWIGLREGLEELQALNSLFQEKISGLGYREDPRGFNPHITLARNGTMDAVRMESVSVPEMEFFFERLVLFRSILSPKGAEYLVLRSADFTGGKA